ncbi:MAG: amidohydrolase family protein [Kordiimonadaceae bacterium]|jgi:L-fuconolactonase|nr:amidohydrolase family protein [Kordiimonadaceae bacterium]MBT6330184.1 amidohydrolase family protein [Kordiimonadaceae bacterium]
MLPFPIIDTHLHIWDTQRLSYSWLNDVPKLNRSFGLDDFNKATGDIDIEQMVFVQCEVDSRQYLDEANWVAEQAKSDPRLSGLVLWAPLENGVAAASSLEKLSGLPNLKGIRRIIQFEEDMEFCLQPKFIEGVNLLADYDLSFDICIDHRHLANTITFARQCPNVPMVLDHIGKPAIAEGDMGLWAKQIVELASMEHVWLKMSGVATEADHASWTKEQLKPYINIALDAFGAERSMFGGDWPVATQAINYSEWISTLLWALDNPSEKELRQIFRNTAKTFYKLK